MSFQKYGFTLQLILIGLALSIWLFQPTWLDPAMWDREPTEFTRSYQKIYYDIGPLKEEGWLVDQKKNGWWKEYNDKGEPMAVGQYTLGKKKGEWIFYNAEGQIEEVKVF